MDTAYTLPCEVVAGNPGIRANCQFGWVETDAPGDCASVASSLLSDGNFTALALCYEFAEHDDSELPDQLTACTATIGGDYLQENSSCNVIMNGLSISRLHAMPLYQESGDIPAQSSPLVVVGVGPDRVLTIWDDEAYGWTYDTFYTLNGRDSIICSGSCIGDSNFVMIVNETRQLDCYDCQLFE